MWCLGDCDEVGCHEDAEHFFDREYVVDEVLPGVRTLRERGRATDRLADREFESIGVRSWILSNWHRAGGYPVTRFIGVDVGGTFTDVVVVSDGQVVASKVATSPNQADAVSEAVDWRSDDQFLHGTTAATNTLLEENGARVGLVADRGFEDLIEIARQDRPSLYDSFVDRPRPLVSREDRTHDPAAVSDVDVIAVALLDSYRDPAAERQLARRSKVPVVLSSDISPTFREYERLATTVLSAYLTPSVAGYVRDIDDRLEAVSKLVMTSSGDLIPSSDAANLAARLVLSGPAGGVVAAAALGSHHGYQSVLTFDMGGTSTDVSRIVSGEPQVGTGHQVGGRVNRVPSVPVNTIGAGGGSVAWVDDGGALRVGPRSAGANPGPAVYGNGGEHATVTDANVLAGNLPRDLKLGGTLQLDVDAGRRVVGRLANRIGMDESSTVAGIIEVVDAHMERALRAVSVEEGADPRDSVLVAFGGAGGLHAARLARRLGIKTVLIPPHSGVFSALGLVMATPAADATRTVLSRSDDEISGALGELAVDASGRYRSMFGGKPSGLTESAAVRYVGQSHELDVDAAGGWGQIVSRFHAAHSEQFGFSRVDSEVEVVNLRVTAEGDPPLRWQDLPEYLPDGSMPSGSVWSRRSLPVGVAINGPGVVIEDNSATLVGDSDTLTVLTDGTLQIDTG